MTEVLQVVGALFIVIPFAAIQRGTLEPHARSYLLLNLIGGLVLGWVAVADDLRQPLTERHGRETAPPERGRFLREE